MKILVTGGAGYIGSVVVEQLIAAKESVVVFDNLSQGHRPAVHPEAAFVQGDLANRTDIDAALSQHRPDAVMHFVSKTLVGESMQKPFPYLGGNVTTGLNLFEQDSQGIGLGASISARSRNHRKRTAMAPSQS
jgi:UDP-glucose 4-epimerase